MLTFPKEKRKESIELNKVSMIGYIYSTKGHRIQHSVIGRIKTTNTVYFGDSVVKNQDLYIVTTSRQYYILIPCL